MKWRPLAMLIIAVIVIAMVISAWIWNERQRLNLWLARCTNHQMVQLLMPRVRDTPLVAFGLYRDFNESSYDPYVMSFPDREVWHGFSVSQAGRVASQSYTSTGFESGGGTSVDVRRVKALLDKLPLGCRRLPPPEKRLLVYHWGDDHAQAFFVAQLFDLRRLPRQVTDLIDMVDEKKWLLEQGQYLPSLTNSLKH